MHAELSVAAKVRFLMREYGLLTPLGDKVRREVMAKYKEFRQMEKNMGSSAMMTIAPIVKMMPADENAFNHLINECK